MPTLDGAIETLQEDYDFQDTGEPSKYQDAVKLGIEGLKREKANRDNPDFVMVGKLPGETEE